MPLHPQAAAVLARSPSVWRDPAAMATMTAVRARAIEAEAKREIAPPPGVAVEDLSIPRPVGPLRARVHRPTARPAAGVVLWIRGGGFVVGSLETDRLSGPLARASGCAVVAVEYRLAPEHPFPEPLDDCRAALRWVAEHARDLGGDGSAVAIGGESAGANLAAAAALAARDDGSPRLALQALLIPLLARDFPGPSRRDAAVGALACPEAIDWIWRQYLAGCDAAAPEPLACPLEAPSLAALPPAVVVTAEYDVLRDEGEAYARRLREDGVAVELRRYDGVHHGFADSLGEIDAADDCVAFLGAAFRRALAPSA